MIKKFFKISTIIIILIFSESADLSKKIINITEVDDSIELYFYDPIKNI
ncbi:MAG: hypothetical protein GX962_03045 [Epulopiscium sp.]|nr:hypothetical protein [Candidatus Epulonipiscium sp.]